MTVSQSIERNIIVLPSQCGNDLTIFELPHPSNNTSKSRIRLFLSNGKTFQLKRHTFSKGCKYNKAKDVTTDRYHYTHDQKPLKSTFFVNENQREDGLVMEQGDFEFSAKYDLAFSLCGAFYHKSITSDESEYIIKNDVTKGIGAEDKNFLTARDFHDALIDNHDKNWSYVSISALENALAQISESIEEAGDQYHKITPQKINNWLAAKVHGIVNNFPSSIPLPKNLPEDVLPKAKVVFACNLLVSMIPQAAYIHLLQYSNDELDIANAFEVYRNYTELTLRKEKEQEILVNAAMKVGMAHDSGKKVGTKKIVKITKIKKVAVKKGAIDGFFKRKT